MEASHSNVGQAPRADNTEFNLFQDTQGRLLSADHGLGPVGMYSSAHPETQGGEPQLPTFSWSREPSLLVRTWRSSLFPHS